MDDIKRLRFEDILWVIFAFVALMNIKGDEDEIKYIMTDNKVYEEKANNTFLYTLLSTLLIYIYFICRNYKAYENANENEKSLYSIKVLGSLFLIIGVLFLIHFQLHEKDFSGSPAL